MNRPWARSCRWLSLLLIVAAVVGAFLVPNPLRVTVAQPAAVRTLAHTDVNPLGANFFLDREVETWKKEQTLKMAREAGLGWVKQMFSWDEIEPQRGVYFNDVYRVKTWDKFDEMVGLAEKYNLRIIARLDRVPAWARRAGTDRTHPPTNFDEFGNFVYEVVKRYRGRVNYYQIWNEPNLAAEWGGQNVDPVSYTRLLQVAYRRAKEADPNVLVLSAPLAQTLEQGPRNISDIEFLRAMYRAGAADAFDILGANAYGFEFTPDDPPAVDRLNFQRVQLLREVMLHFGDAGKAVWLNEVGWNAAPASFPLEKLIWRRVTEGQQADYTARALELARSWDWVGVVGLWYFRQVGDIPASDAAYYFRVVDVDFTPRPLYGTLQKIAASLAVAHPGLHQETSPAVAPHGDWSLRLLKTVAGGSALVSETPGDWLNFTFEGTEVSLITARGADGGLLAAQVDGAPSPSLTRDKQGQTYLDLRRAVSDSQGEVLLARGLPPGKHTVRLEVKSREPAASAGTVIVDGFVVGSEQPSFWQFYGVMGLVFVGLGGFVFSFYLRRQA